MRLRLTLLATVLALPLMAGSGWAQSPAPDAHTLDLAKQLVAKTGGDRDQTIASLSALMAGFMQQMGITDPVKAKELVDEAILPLLREHYDGLVDIQAKAYAQALSSEDLTAILAFYNTKAGQDLLRAQPTLTQARLTGVTQWIGAMQPEIQARVQKTAKAHGWTNG